MTPQQFNELKSRFGVTSYKVSKNTRIAEDTLSKFASKDNAKLSPDNLRRVNDYFACLAIEKKDIDFFPIAWFFDDFVITVHKKTEDELLYKTLEMWTVRVFELNSQAFNQLFIPSFIFHTEQEPSYDYLKNRLSGSYFLP